jgi:DNA polymerase-3 subunit delta
MHAVEYLKQDAPTVPSVVVLTGGQRHLKQAALSRLRSLVIADDDASLTRFTGKETDLQSVSDELRTVSMWGERRLVVIDDADDFVSKNRASLEKYVDSPAKRSVLVLDVASWPKTTRLAKQLAKSGLDIECTELKGASLSKWLIDTARDTHQATLQRDAAALLIELAGDELGLLDQELAKLSAYVGQRKQITTEDVRGLVGGWRTETTWAMTDAVRDGRLPDALEALGQLLEAGEAGPKLLGGINFVFRKLAYATELARRGSLDAALKDAAVFPRDIGPAAAYLRRIGREKAEQILTALVTADAGLKGMSRLPERLQMELLLLRLSGGA